MLDDILFCASVLTFSAAAILAYWQLLRAEADGLDEPVLRFGESDVAPEPVPSAI